MNYDEIILLNSTKLGNRQMKLSDSKGFCNMKHEDFQLPTNFYGNQVSNIAKTTHPGIYLLVDRRSNIFDILVKKEEIAGLAPAEIRDILDAKRITYTKQCTKKHLLSLLDIELIEEADPNPDSNGNKGASGSEE